MKHLVKNRAKGERKIFRHSSTAIDQKPLKYNIHVAELRLLPLKMLLWPRDYPLAEKLCLAALKKDPRGYFNKPALWAYYLEKLYAETANQCCRSLQG